MYSDIFVLFIKKIFDCFNDSVCIFHATRLCYYTRASVKTEKHVSAVTDLWHFWQTHTHRQTDRCVQECWSRALWIIDGCVSNSISFSELDEPHTRVSDGLNGNRAVCFSRGFTTYPFISLSVSLSCCLSVWVFVKVTHMSLIFTTGGL